MFDEKISNIQELANRIGEVLKNSGSPKYYTTSEVATLLNLTPRSIFNLRGKGMPHYKIGSRVLFLESEVIDFVKKHSVSLKWS